MKPCSLGGCTAIHYARGWCRRHYRIWRDHGDPEHPVRQCRKRPEDGVCIAPGCEREARPTGCECSTHHQRRLKHGSYDLPPKVKKPRIPVGTRRTDKYGYVFVYRPDRDDSYQTGFMSEHRMVMADHLGRALRPEESVHHKNGIRNDNRIENLELWVGVGQQPSGARIADLVDWARGLVERYERDLPLLRQN